MNKKKVLAMMLTALTLVTLVVPSTSALDDGWEISYEPLPTLKEGCYRYYFLVPDDWFNEYTDKICIYWWEGTNAQASWPGVKANKGDADNIYYYNVPKDVTSFIWNNYIELPSEPYESEMHLNTQDVKVTVSSSDEYDGMVFVIDPDLTIENSYGNKVYSGYWHKYLGTGKYEISEISGDANIDSILNIKDATAIQKHIANITKLSERGLKNADFNTDETINVKDATAIQKHLANIR